MKIRPIMAPPEYGSGTPKPSVKPPADSKPSSPPSNNNSWSSGGSTSTSPPPTTTETETTEIAPLEPIEEEEEPLDDYLYDQAGARAASGGDDLFPEGGPTSLVDILAAELDALDGIQSQNPETGAGINQGKSYIKQYTNKIFGSPFQLMDSVDKRWEGVNTYVGSEFLRNFILSSPILHIKPGLPLYTGGATSNALVESIKQTYLQGATGDMSIVQTFIEQFAKSTLFSAGSKLQKRMFGFQERYYSYMSYVNYMCRSMAVFLNLTADANTGPWPIDIEMNGSGSVNFENADWSNYRMLADSQVLTPREQFSAMGDATLIGALGKSAWHALKEKFGDVAAIPGGVADVAKEIGEDIGWNEVMKGLLGAGDSSVIGALGDIVGSALSSAAGVVSEDLKEDVAETVGRVEHAFSTSMMDVMVDKICSVLFMVEPVQFTESLNNETKDSVIETLMQAPSEVGTELAFITGSNVDFGHIEGLTEFLGATVSAVSGAVEKVVSTVGGGFAANLIHGLVGGIKGQRMIYPKIYQRSSSAMNYEFTVNLSSPYGDVYNYYVNIVVPLMHLIALASPRMVSANSQTSPFLVQAFIPGMCTCQLGIISQMTITKNPDANRVSVNGFPLDVKVTFTIEELYNAMSISPANDPASFLFNETLNSYMSNLAGLQPAVDTYSRQRQSMFKSLASYFTTGEFKQDMRAQTVYRLEQFANPFASSGS